MNSNRKHDFNQEFFDIIDTEEKAYILGFIYADGCNNRHPSTGELSIAQMERDIDILLKIKKAMDSTYPISEEKIKSSKEKKLPVFIH